MSVLIRYHRLWGAGLLALFLGLGGAAPGEAQTVRLTRPTNGPAKLGGVRRLDVTLSAPPAGAAWVRVGIEIRTLAGVLEESGDAALLPGSTLASYECVTAAHPDASYKIQAFGYLKQQSTGVETIYASPVLTDEVDNPTSTRPQTREGLRQSWARDAPATRLLAGGVTFAVPITRWDFKGESYGFGLTYDSQALLDPQSPGAGFSGLGERNSYGQSAFRWSHTYHQWIDRVEDETGQLYAVWHLGPAASRSSGRGPGGTPRNRS